MENYMTIDEAVDLYGESVFGETSDIFEDFEGFPTKDRSNAARRKKAYFKGKKRFNRVFQNGFTPSPEKEKVIKGMLRKTNVVTANYDSDPYFKIDVKAAKRNLDTKK